MGCVGKDKYAEIMTEKARSVGLNVVYQYHEKEPTGRCAVLITGKHRYNRFYHVFLSVLIYSFQKIKSFKIKEL